MTPLEVWDVLVDGTPLHAIPRTEHFPSALARLTRSLISGEARSGSSSPFPPACRDITHIALVGGAADTLDWPPDALPRLTIASPEHCAERGGHALLARLGQRGLVVDLGQSRLKIAGPDRRWTHPRDYQQIPISARPVTDEGRAALLTFFADALREAVHATAPEALVLALPCELAPDGTPGTCSYPWRAGDPIVLDLLGAAGLTDLPTHLLNDAELAALGVAELPPPSGTTLVLTLGFGVGGALLKVP